jgi:hypothetical protein
MEHMAPLQRRPESTHCLIEFVTAILLDAFLRFSRLPEISIVSIRDPFVSSPKEINPIISDRLHSGAINPNAQNADAK